MKKAQRVFFAVLFLHLAHTPSRCSQKFYFAHKILLRQDETQVETIIKTLPCRLQVKTCCTSRRYSHHQDVTMCSSRRYVVEFIIKTLHVHQVLLSVEFIKTARLGDLKDINLKKLCLQELSKLRKKAGNLLGSRSPARALKDLWTNQHCPSERRWMM